MPEFMYKEIEVDLHEYVLRWTLRDVIAFCGRELTEAKFDIEKPLEFTIKHGYDCGALLSIRQEKRFKLRSPYEVIPCAIL